jgi:hypothetical protein
VLAAAAAAVEARGGMNGTDQSRSVRSTPRRSVPFGAPHRHFCLPVSLREAGKEGNPCSTVATVHAVSLVGWIKMSGDSNYSYSYLNKALIWISVFVFDFNIDVK